MKKLLVIKEGQHKDIELYIKAIKKEADKRKHDVTVLDLKRFKDFYFINFVMNESDGIIIANPITKEMGKIMWNMMLEQINKDLDNYTGFSIYRNCTLNAITELLYEDGINISSKDITVLGRHLGGIIRDYMEQADATVTMCHSKTKNTNKKIGMAEIVISCVGKKVIKPEYCHKRQVIIDVGGDLFGDLQEYKNKGCKIYTFKEIAERNINNIFNNLEDENGY